MLLYLILATTLGYGAAVWYALQNDNFHDFFTEYIPLGEEIVLYFEERSFQKRFPHARHHVHTTPSARAPESSRVTIPSKSGLSWKVSDETAEKAPGLTEKGKQMSAVDENKPPHGTTQDVLTASQKAVQKVEAVKKEPTSSRSTPAEEKKVEPEAATTPQPVAETPSPKADPRPPAIAPVQQLSLLEVPNADEPLVHELVKMFNDIVTVINADSAEAANRYSGPIHKAKESLAEVGKKIMALKDAERKAAEHQIQQAHREFDEGARQLLKRIETAQEEDGAKFRQEFEAERERIEKNYEDKLKAEVERSQELANQRLLNQLSEQAIEMKRKFVAQIKDLVEAERDGRLSKLHDLSTDVGSLQELTSNWNGVIDSNLATQKLQVAVDAVRSAVSNSNASDDRPKPFVREMAALKLVADNDPVVDAAIASIDPSAYQKGIPSPAQLVDRFRRVAAEVRKASLLPEDAGVASHAASYILSKVMFKKQGQPQGTDVESVLTRTETLLEEGDLDGAAREMNTLQGWAGVLSKDWLQDCRKVLEVRQALDVIETEAKLQCLRVEST